MKIPLLLSAYLLCFAMTAFSQDSSKVNLSFIKSVSTTSTKLQQRLHRQTERTLQQFRRQEDRLRKKLAKTDTSAANAVFGDANKKYAELNEQLKDSTLTKYFPSLDSLSTSLSFLKTNSGLLSQHIQTQEQLNTALQKMSTLKAQMARSEQLKTFIKERRQYLKDQLGKLGFAKEFKRLNKQAYYYSQRLAAAQATLKDPKKAVKKGLELLSKNKTFREFWRKNSQLARLFHIPGEESAAVNMASLAGLQTRAQVNNLIQQRLSAGGPDARAQLQQNMQAAQSQLSQLKDKVMKYGGGSSDAAMPEGFKPNNQKTKSFLQRLELGTNIQSVRSNGLLPVTSDLGLSLGYKLNDKSIIGLGASYKMGWGKNIQNISITHQGVGARSFVDWKLKGAFWISGGFEMNYRPDLSGVSISSPFGGSRMGAAWQQSGLIGLSRKIPLKTKFFKNTKLMLLWDFLSYEQVPRTQPVVVRFGYNF